MINEIEEKAVIYVICNYCIHKNISAKTIKKLLDLLGIKEFNDNSQLLTYIFRLGYTWNKTNHIWDKNMLNETLTPTISLADVLSHKEPIPELKLPYTLSELDKEIEISPNDAQTLLKNMSAIQGTLNQIIKSINKDKK